MLVLSRRNGESIEIPELGIVIRVTSIKKSRITLGIEAPKELAILRGEISETDSATESEIEGKLSRQCFAMPSVAAATVKELPSGYSLSTPDQTSFYQVA